MGDGEVSWKAPGARGVWLVVGAAMLAVLALMAVGTRAEGTTREGEPVLDEDPGGRDYVAGELLATFGEGVGPGAKEEAAEAVGGNLELDLTPDVPAAPATHLVSFDAIKARAQETGGSDQRERALAAEKRALDARPGVVSVDYNYVRTRDLRPNDPRFGGQWGLAKTGFPSAWDRSKGLYLKVGVIDSGVDTSHPDLAGKVADQRDFAQGDVRAQDTVGHGTAVSGVVAAGTNNASGVAGACFRCRLLVAKDGGQRPVDSWSIKGIYWAAANGAKAINISSGGYARSEAYEAAVDYAVSRGAVVVASAGNDATDQPRYPAAYDNALSVVATNRGDARASFSNYGPTVDLAAPGVDVLSTRLGGGYSYASGTSFAAPHVAALAGLVRHQGLTAQQARAAIEDSAADLGAPGRDSVYGNGRIRAGAAVR